MIETEHTPLNMKRTAYDIKCKKQCKTLSLSKLKDKSGNLNTSRHGFLVFEKPCEFPFRMGSQTFYGCVGSNLHDDKGPWCYTKLSNITGNNQWGYCSDDCPIENCPKHLHYELG